MREFEPLIRRRESDGVVAHDLADAERVHGDIAPPHGLQYFLQAFCGPARRVFLFRMVCFGNIHIGILEKFPNEPRDVKEDIDPRGKICRKDDGYPAHCLHDCRPLTTGVAGRPDDKRFFVRCRNPRERKRSRMGRKIYDDIGGEDARGGVISRIHGADDRERGIFFCARDEEFSHASFGAADDDVRFFHTLKNPNVRKVVSSRARFAALMGVSGRRYVSCMRPAIASAALTGIGFVSMKRSLKTGEREACSSRALTKFPSRAACTMSRTCRWRMLEATLITPSAPTLIIGSVSESSPERMEKSSPKSARSGLMRSVVPVASLRPTIPAGRSLRRRTIVSIAMPTPVRPGIS